MKFVNYLEKITGVSVYPLISLLLFFTIFIVVIIMTVRMPNKVVEEMENLPLENDN